MIALNPEASDSVEVDNGLPDDLANFPTLEYAIELPCVPRKHFGTVGLQQRLRAMERLEDPFSIGPGVIAVAREAMFELRPLAFHCNRCPANTRQREFSCHGRVDFPISAEAEAWMMSLLPQKLSGSKLDAEEAAQAEQVRILTEFLQDRGITGQRAERLRKPGLMWESVRQVHRNWGWLFRRVHLSSSELFEALFLAEELDPALMEAVLRALGVWVETGKVTDGQPEVLFTQPVDDRDPTSIAELKYLFHTAMIACSLNLPLRTRLVEPGEADAA